MASIIPIDSNLNLSEEVADYFIFLMNENRPSLPKLSLFEILLARTRPGLDASVLASSIISRFPEAGIPQGPLVGGTTNVWENIIRIICEELVNALQNDARVDASTEPGIALTASGANAGGAVITVGATTNPGQAYGVIR